MAVCDSIVIRGEERRAIRLKVNGYSWTDAEETADLLSLTVRVEDAPFSGSLTVDAGIEALDGFCRALAAVLSDGVGMASFETWERDFRLNVELDEWGRVRVEATLNALEYVQQGARVTGGLSGTVFAAPRVLEAVLRELRQVLEAFPGRGGPLCPAARCDLSLGDGPTSSAA